MGKEKIKVLSLFSGAGGLDLGLELAQHPEYEFEVVWANDNYKPAVKTYKRNFGNIISSEDVWKIDFKKVPSCDVVVGGFPCQDFSVLSKRKGIKTRRGMLYTRIVDALEEKEPPFFLAENVKGLMSANNGEAFEAIKEDFANAGLGYNVHAKVINFADYGVPQTRERLIFVGIRKDLFVDFKFPKTTHKEPVTAEEALRGVEEVKHNNEKTNHKKSTIEKLKNIPPGGNYKDLPKGMKVKGLMSNIYRRLHPDEPAYTVIANGGGGTWGYHYSEPRALTNRERARLQSFPDDFVFEGSVSEVRKQIGNAVPPVGIKPIAEKMLILYEKLFKNGLSQ